MIDMLVRLLETGLENQENPAATKAQIVKALKAMQTSLKFGEEVSLSRNSSPSHILSQSIPRCMLFVH